MVGPFGRLLVDPFESVDTAKAYLKFLSFFVRRSQLVDGACEALRDLSLFGKSLYLFLAFASLPQLLLSILSGEVQSAKTRESCE